MAEIGAAVYSTIAERIKKISDGIIERNLFLSELKKRGRLKFSKGGSSHKFPVRKSDSAIAGYTSDLGTGGATTTQPFTEAEWQWRQFIARLFILGFQQERNEASSEIAKIFTMAKAQLEEVEQSAKTRIGRGVYGDGSTQESSDNGTPVSGLEEIVDDDNTYLGLARSTETYWQAQIEDVTGTPSQDSVGNGVTNLERAMDNCYLSCCVGKGMDGDGVKNDLATEKEEPEMVITTRTGFNLYKHALKPQMRYTGRTGSDLTSLMIGKASVEFDPACTANRFYFLNFAYLNFYCVNAQLLKMQEGIKSGSPYGTLHLVTSQHQLWSQNPRYLGAVRWT